MSGELILHESTGVSVPSEKLEMHIAASEFWEKIASIPTPKRYIRKREGSEGKMLSYSPQYYFIRMLDKIFPGWTLEFTSPLIYHESIRTFQMTGKMTVRYFDPLVGDYVTRTLPGIGSQYVKAKKDNPTMPVQPDDMAKACRTELIKHCAYLFGIGRDLYDQSITDEQIARYEMKVDEFDGGRTELNSAAIVITDKESFDTFLDSLPTTEQLDEIRDLINQRPEEKRARIWALVAQHTKDNIKNLTNRLKETIEKEKSI